MKDNLYLAWVSKTLLSYQMLEEALKLSIGISNEIIAASIPPELDFKFAASSINDAPLGQLIRMFSNVSKNETLVNELKTKELLKWRNFCAHNAFKHEFMERTAKSSFTQHSTEDLEIVARSVGELVDKFGEEIKKLQNIHSKVLNASKMI